MPVKQTKKQKRALAIHDISCFGRCSLTVALPILSAAGIETSVIPTAVLSTHTGGFTEYTFRDLTPDIMPIARHWEKIGLLFDAVYTGYLGSFEQLAVIQEVFSILTENSLKFIDPVMADNGSLYSGFSVDFPKGMTKLCCQADIIVPNLTEAALLLGEDADKYTSSSHTETEIMGLLKKLAEISNHTAVITGVSFAKDKIGVAAYEKNTGIFSCHSSDRIPGHYHGTGDIFGSVMLAGLLCGQSVQTSIKAAVDFVAESIMRTKETGDDLRFGVNFEDGLRTLYL